MANCKELHPDVDGQQTQAYKDCVAEKKTKKSELSPMQEAINKNRAEAGLEPQDNSNKVYDPTEDDDKLAEVKPSVFEKFVKKAKLAKELIDTTLDVKEDIEKENILKGIQINDDIYLPEGSENMYHDSFIETMGAGLSSDKINEITPEEDKQFARLGYETAMYKHKDTPNYKPSTMEINAEAYRLKALALTEASGEKSTMAEQLLGKSNPVAGLFSDIYRSVKGGINSTSALDGIYGVYSSTGTPGDQEVIDYVESYQAMLEANQTSDAMKSYQADIEKGDGSIISSLIAITKNPMVLPDVGISSMTMMASSVIESDFVKANAAAGMVAGAGTGAAVGSIGGPLAAVTSGAGAIAGTMGGVSYGMEALFTFGDVILDELGGDPADLTVENVKKLLSDPEKFKEIRKRADSRARNVAGTDFAVTLLTLGAGKALLETGKVSKKVVGGLATTAEMVGGSTGEYLGQKASGLGYNASDIVMEGVANLGTSAPVTVAKLFNDLQQTANGTKINRNVKANGFADMSDAFQPDADISSAQVDAINTPMAESVLDSQLENKMRRKIITQVEAAGIKDNFKETQVALKRIKSLGLSTEQQAITAGLLKEKINLEKTIKQVNDTNLTNTESSRITEINNLLRNVIEDSKKPPKAPPAGNLNVDTTLQKDGLTPVDNKSTANNDVEVDDYNVQDKKLKVNPKEQSKKGKEIDNLAGPKNKEGRYTVTKAEWDSGKADEVITEIYSNDMLIDLIKSKIPSEKPPGFSKPDFISGAIAELIPHIRNFNPEINNSLNGWIIPQVNNKIGNVFKKGEAVTKAKFETSLQTGKVDGTSIDIADTDANTIEEKIDIKDAEVKAETKAIDKLRDVIGITPEGTKTLGDKIVGGNIRTQPVKGVANPSQRDVGKTGTVLESEKIIKSMGGKIGTVNKNNDLGNYITFLEIQGKDILTVLNSKDLDEIKNTKLRDLYKPKKVDRVRGVQNVKGAGKGVFEYGNANPTAQDLVDWATNKDLPATTKIARQQTLADILGNALGRVSTAETARTVEGAKKFIDTQKILGNKIPSDIIEKLIKDIDIRIAQAEVISNKYKGTLSSGFNPGIAAKALSSGLKIFKKVLIKTKDFAKALKALIKRVRSFFDNKIEADIAEKVIREEITIENTNGVDLDAMIDDIVEKINISRGIAYEQVIYNNAKGVKNLNFEVSGTQTEVDGAADFQSKLAGKQFDVEVKLEKPQYSSVNGTYDFVKGVFNYSANSLSSIGPEFRTELDKLLIKAKTPLQNYYDKLKELGVDLKTSGTAIPLSVFNQLGRKGFNLQSKITQRVTLDEKVLEELYNAKGVYYIQIKGKGIYYMGKNPLNLPFPKLEGKVNVTFRIARSATDKNGNVRPILRFLPDDMEITGPKSNFSIDTAAGINKLLNTPEAKKLIEINESKIKADTVIEKGKEFVKNNPDAIPVAADPVVLDKDINKIIEDTKGIKARFRYSDIVAKRKGAGVRSFKIIPAGAQDFSGLMYDLYGKGKKGEIQQKWVKDNLTKPYQNGVAKIDKYRQALKNDYSALLKKFPEVSGKLGSIIPGTEFTFDQALRVNLWTQGGFEIPGLSKRDIKKLNDIVEADPELKLFNESALAITKQPKWVSPSPHWDVESLISDLNSLTTKVGRKEYLAEFITNKNVIFSKENLNKMEVALGTNWREAMEDSLYRMENGTNRPSGSNKLTNDFLNWVNNSVGAIMFLNVKSALLQTISSVNFLNWSDNNPFKAGLALANFPQYVKDFSFLWNSPKLIQRRSGLRKDINEAELANAAQGSKNKPAAMLSYLLKLGFTPTQLADSFAIASGGATFYRNRLNTYKKQGLSEAEASDKAFEDFAEASDVAQQSADPMLISQQQASVLGRLLLAFQNTPAQVTRIFNKASRDFINNRGDQKTNISKMMYYGAIQGFIFAALQNAAFALIPGFDEEEDKEKKAREFDKKEERILNSMVDTMLRGSGVYGAIVATLKNTALTYYREEKKDAFGRDHRNTLLEIMNLSPPVGSKIRKINNAIKAKDYNKEVVKEQGWDVTLKGKVNLSPSYQVIASLTEAITNLPLERAVVEIGRVVEVLDARNTTFQRVALALGYRTWDVNVKNEERDLVKIESKEAKEKARKQKVIDDRAERKRLKEVEKYKGKTEDEIKQMKRRDSIVDTNKSAQMKSLINLGLTKKQIKELKYEDDRVNKIIELTNK